MSEEKEKATVAKNEKEKLSGEELVDFVSNGKSKHMPKDEEYQVTKDMAQIFLEKGYGKLK